MMADEADSAFAAFTRSFRSNIFAPPAPPLPPSPPTPPSAPRNLAALDLDRFESAPSGNSSLIWQPLPLRATFRPLNRQNAANARASRGNSEAVGIISERSISVDAANSADTSPFSARTFFPTREQDTTTTTTTTTSAPLLDFEPEDELPTRQPMQRFRPPTRAAASGPTWSAAELSSDDQATPGAPASQPLLNANNTNVYQISNECFECICEASTNCNVNSKCQTSDVRHTRCGMFLISYDQWLTSELSKELVSSEALTRDAAADERAFYECVTNRDCAQRLLTILMQRRPKDCDRDGRIDCYDLAAVHHSGPDQCASESLLDSQYWSDFNACLGFGR